jgi:hypothetical protein
MGYSHELLRLRVAGITFSFLQGEGVRGIEVDAISGPFVTGDRSDVRIRVHWGVPPPSQVRAGTLLQNDQAKIILDGRFRDGDMYVTLPDALQDIFLFDRLHAFLDLAIMTYFIGSGRAVPIHACGIDDNGRGLLFTGPSDSGKTTLANLWKDRPGATVLSDERLFLRRREGGFWMYGSLLKSGAILPSPQGARVDGIFFIGHAVINAVSPRGAKESAIALLKQALPYWYYYLDEPYPLGFCVELSQGVPCADLGFVPDDRIVDCVRGLA